MMTPTNRTFVGRVKWPNHYSSSHIVWWYRYHHWTTVNDQHSVLIQFKFKYCISAAWRGGDGTVEEWELTSRRVYRDGDWEVEDRAAVANSRAASLWWAGWCGEHLGLKLQELTHEAKVWGDDAATLLDKLKGLIQLDTVCPHEVGETNCGGAGDAGLTMHKNSTSFISYRV